MRDDAELIEQSLRACAAGSRTDCDTFFRLARPLFQRIAGRVAQQYAVQADTEDIVQEVSVQIAVDAAAFAEKIPAGKTLSYIAVVAANSARDWFRARGAIKRGRSQTTHLTEDVICPDGQRMSSQERGVLLMQVERSLPPLSRERSIYQLYFQQGYSAREIAAIPTFQLNQKGVESLILRLTRQIREKLTQGEGSSSRKASLG